MTIEMEDIARVFSVGDIIKSGGERTEYRISKILDDRLRISSTSSAKKATLWYYKLALVLDAFATIDPHRIQDSITELLKKTKTPFTQNESYLYGLARAYVRCTDLHTFDVPMRTRTDGAFLNDFWKAGAAHALYIHDGHWYHPLKRFPGALFDRNGYVLFAKEKDYRSCPYLSISKQISVRKPGISAIPSYVRVVREENEQSSPFSPLTQDVDIHAPATGAIEGRARLVRHLEREHDQSIVRKKKRLAASLDCEVCGFSFKRAYGTAAAGYCEVHHLVPLSEVGETTETRMEDLAILCANCHRVVHLENPPHTLHQVRLALSQSSFGKRQTTRSTATRKSGARSQRGR